MKPFADGGEASLANIELRCRSHDVHEARRASNQLGIYHMCGNVWEWCEDACVNGIDAVPRDCTVSFRYGIARDSHDGCIGFRLVLAPA